MYTLGRFQLMLIVARLLASSMSSEKPEKTLLRQRNNNSSSLIVTAERSPNTQTEKYCSTRGGENVSLEHKPDSWAQITGRCPTSNAWSYKRACAEIIPINLVVACYLWPDLAHLWIEGFFSRSAQAQICSYTQISGAGGVGGGGTAWRTYIQCGLNMFSKAHTYVFDCASEAYVRGL